MPELPEVETTRRGLKPLLIKRRITAIEISPLNLRQRFNASDANQLIQQGFTQLDRRGKYLIVQTTHPTLDLLIHLGMSGSLRVNPIDSPRKKHDHIIITLDNQQALRYHDPRRFGFIKAIKRNEPIIELQHLGLEPLDQAFNGQYLYERSRRKTQAVKNFIMDQTIVVGVGNIYATEALFHSRIHPNKRAKDLSHNDYTQLCTYIQQTLNQAIESGGTTLKDFMHSDGRGGYFQQTLNVYGKAGKPCPSCEQPIERLVIGGRNSCFCPQCQPLI